MFGIGSTELLIILALAIILLGPKKIPEIARAIGKLTASARRAADDLKDQINKSGEQDTGETEPARIDSAPKGDLKCYEDDDAAGDNESSEK